MTPEPIDLVYTWVDDATPGYLDELRRYASNANDLNPNRTRDNLQLLRYSLRSVARFAPWVRRVVLLTRRPQVPDWLEPGTLELVHHDQIMDAGLLPTFNSFAIISHLHLLPGLSRRFLYLEDDMLFGAPVAQADFVDAQDLIRVFPRLTHTPEPQRRTDTAGSPWDAAVANSNHLLDQRFGLARRRTVNHVPLLVDRGIWDEMLAAWPDAAQATRRSRFRAAGNIAPEYLYPHYLLATGRGIASSLAQSYRRSFYFPLENSVAFASLLIRGVRAWRPQFLTLNDNFGARPHPGVVRRVARFLEDYFPSASRYERAPA
jgi:hypothetical protein